MSENATKMKTRSKTKALSTNPSNLSQFMDNISNNVNPKTAVKVR